MKKVIEKKVIGIVGPTASFKSEVGEKLFKNGNFKIINADSQQLYKGLNLLSSVPENYKNYFLYAFLTEKINAFEWAKLAVGEINKAFENNVVPVVLGGTGMYFKILQDGISSLPEIGLEIESKVDSYSSNEIDNFLEKYDLKAFEKFKDYQRRKKALKVFLQTKKSILDSFENQLLLENGALEIHSLLPSKEVIWKNIEHRLYSLDFEELCKEVQVFEFSDTNVIGFSEIKSYLNGVLSKKDTQEKILFKTRQYAKRQRTYIKNSLKVESFYDSPSALFEFIITNN